QMWRRDDHAHRQGQRGRPLSLLHLLDQGPAGQDGVRRSLNPDGPARSTGREPSGGTLGFSPSGWKPSLPASSTAARNAPSAAVSIWPSFTSVSAKPSSV